MGLEPGTVRARPGTYPLSDSWGHSHMLRHLPSLVLCKGLGTCSTSFAFVVPRFPSHRVLPRLFLNPICGLETKWYCTPQGVFSVVSLPACPCHCDPPPGITKICWDR